MGRKLAITQQPSIDLLGDLRRLGFTEYEARIYIQLLRQSPATAYEIAKSTGVPRPNTYHALETLAHRGAVLPVSEQPIKYVAADPHELLDAIARQTRSLCSKLGDRLRSMSSQPNDKYVWMLRGESAIHDKIDALIAGSRHAILVKAADEVLRHHKEALRAAANRGVETLIVLFGFDADEFRFTSKSRVYIHEATGVRIGTADNLFTIAADHAEMLTAALDGEMVAAHTRNRPVVTMAESLIRHDYYMAEIFARFGPEIDEAFGPHLRDLRLNCFSPEQAMVFAERTGLLASPAQARAPKRRSR